MQKRADAAYDFLYLRQRLVHSMWAMICILLIIGPARVASAQATIQIGDLSVAIAASPNPVPAGGTITYTINVYNAGQIICSTPTGPCRMDGPTISDIDLLFDITKLWAGSIQSFGGDSGFECSWSIEPGIYVWCSKGIIPSGSTATISVITAAPSSSGTYTGDAYVDVFRRLIERSKANNKATVTISVP
jgi:Domain of unknown function DUF11